MKGKHFWPWPGKSRAANEDELARLVDALADRLCRGERIDWKKCFTENPRHADSLMKLALALQALADMRVSERDTTASDDTKELE